MFRKVKGPRPLCQWHGAVGHKRSLYTSRFSPCKWVFFEQPKNNISTTIDNDNTALSLLTKSLGPSIKFFAIQKLFRNKDVRIVTIQREQDVQALLTHKATPSEVLLPHCALLVPRQPLLNIGWHDERDVEALKAQVEAKAGVAVENGCDPSLQKKARALQLQLQLRGQVPFEVIYEDDDMLAINKPPNICVHAGHTPREETVDGKLRDLGLELRLVHRLDFGTSGCLVLAKSGEAASELCELFRHTAHKAIENADNAPSGSKGVSKVYIGVVVPRDKELFYKKEQEDLLASTFIARRGKSARSCKTKYAVLCSHSPKGLVWLKMLPATGRRHQLRRLCAEQLHAPLLGETKYGRSRKVVRANQIDKKCHVKIDLVEEGEEDVETTKEQQGYLSLHCSKITVRRQGQPPIVLRAALPPHMRALRTEAECQCESL